MAEIEKVWKVEEDAKRNRTIINSLKRDYQEEDVCAVARSRIIQLNDEIARLEYENSQLKQNLK